MPQFLTTAGESGIDIFKAKPYHKPSSAKSRGISVVLSRWKSLSKSQRDTDTLQVS